MGREVLTTTGESKTTMKKQDATKYAAGTAPGDWREAVLERVRALIREAAPGVVEEVKWRKPSNGMVGVPVWSLGGMICTGETYKDKVKLTFAKGAALEDPAGLFNASLEGNARRAINIGAGEVIDGEGLKGLIRAAVALNGATGGGKK